MKTKKTVICTAIAATLLCTAIFSGCGNNNNHSSSNSSSNSNSNQSSVSKSNDSQKTNKKSSAPEASKTQDKNEDDDTGPIPEISDPTPESEGEYGDGGIFIYNNVAYELFYGGQEAAKEYADTISFVKKQLGDKFTVYNVVVPTHVGVDLPDKFKDLCNPQDTYLDTIVKSYTADVKGVNAFNKIVHHRNEYLYFNSDHHWTALGAYYAYRTFAKAAGITPVDIKSLKSDSIKGYTGSFAYFSGRDDLKEDTVTYYYPDYEVDCTKYDEKGENPEDYPLLHTYASGSNSYGVFLGGDVPVMVTKNKNGNGKKIAVLKESYGNAFSPFIAYSYSEAHLIDFRYAEIDLKSYLEKNGITDVIIINNSMASATSARLEELQKIAGGTVSDSEENYDSTDITDDDNTDAADDDNTDTTDDDNTDNTDDDVNNDDPNNVVFYDDTENNNEDDPYNDYEDDDNYENNDDYTEDDGYDNYDYEE